MKSIDGATFKRMLIAGANRLEENKQLVDEMNVFPVPDGDTGTNMSFTVTSAAKEVLKTNSENVYDYAAAMSSGALRGARGNSGVIVSQLFRGMAKGLKGQKTLDAVSLALALNKGVETAYKAVMKPKEGTILTVAREAAEQCMEFSLQHDDLEEVLRHAIACGQKALDKTPEMLPVLKEAGVVDAGGYGLILIYTGMLDAMISESEECEPLLALQQNAAAAPAQTQGPAQTAFATEDITFAYCTEFIAEGVDNAESHEDELREFLSQLGDSLVVVADGDLIKVHVHTNDPGTVIRKATSLGYLTSVKIENMKLQHQNILDMAEAAAAPKTPEAPAMPHKAMGFVAVSTGEGFKEIFEGLGVDYVITGGQTMNPSTEDVLQAAEAVNADHIFVLPNNKNIILAAEQAAKMIEGKTIHVIPSTTVPQGITAMINYIGGDDAEAIAEAMTESLPTVVTGQLTFAVRDTKMGEFEIHENDILALKDGKINQVGTDLRETACQLLDSMMESHSDIVSIYYGEDVSEEDAQILAAYVQEVNPDAEVEIYNGGQPLYYYVLSAE